MPLILLGVIIFPLYIEAILFSFIIDSAYGVVSAGNIFFHFPGALISTLIIIVLIPLREKIRLHA